jgi:hypothetical protein
MSREHNEVNLEGLSDQEYLIIRDKVVLNMLEVLENRLD